jgi:hypothetical protein
MYSTDRYLLNGTLSFVLKNFFLVSDAGKLTTASVSSTGIIIYLPFWLFPFCVGDGGFIEIHKDFVDLVHVSGNPSIF